MSPDIHHHRFSGIAGKVLGWMAGVVILVLGIAAWFHYSMGWNQIQVDLFMRAHNSASRLAIGLRQPIYGFDREAIRDLLKAEFTDPEVLAVVVTRPPRESDRILCAMQRGANEIREVSSPPQEEGLAYAREKILFQRAGEASGTSEILGTVGVFLTPRPAISFLARDLQGYAIELAALLTGLLFVTSLILGGALVRPLEALRRSMLGIRDRMTSAEGGSLPRLPEENPVAPSRSAFHELRQMGDLYKMMLQAINERQEALSQSEEDLRITLDSIGDAVIATDCRGLVTRLNPAAGAMIEREPSRCLGLDLSELLLLVDPESQTLAGDLVPRVLAGGGIIRLSGDAVLRIAGGVERRVEISGSPIRTGDGAVVGTVLVFRDVSEQRRLEERLRHTQKMDAIGQLAGGVAHDFNNMLAGILGYAELLQEAVVKDARLNGYACNVIQTAQRAAALTRQLLAYSRKGAVIRKPMHLQQVVMDVLSILRRTIDRRVEIVVEFGGGDPLILGDAALIQNALLNLSVNARDAMPQGGTLEFRSQTVVIAAGDSFPGFDITPGSFIEVLVRDTGVGMVPEVQRRLFEPFFTTKDVGKGTGLGLAAVYGTMKEHLGAIDVRSQPGRGTSFRLLFPLAPEGTKLEDARKQQVALPAGSGTVLIIDDEELVRRMMQSTLELMGFNCIEASDGISGVERFRENLSTVRLVILDMVLPRRHGREVLADLRSIDPGKPVLIISGYSRDEQTGELMEQPNVGFLQKPFTMSLFQQRVTELLRDGAAPAAKSPTPV